jgi:hypothetical protein
MSMFSVAESSADTHVRPANARVVSKEIGLFTRKPLTATIDCCSWTQRRTTNSKSLLTLNANVNAKPASEAEVGVTSTTTPVSPTMADDSILNRAETHRETVQAKTERKAQSDQAQNGSHVVKRPGHTCTRNVSAGSSDDKPVNNPYFVYIQEAG